MEQDVDTTYRSVCSACLSSDRNLFSINATAQLYEIFRLLTYNFATDRIGDAQEMQHYVCWECLALIRRFVRFKRQVQSAQEHLRVLALSQAQESIDHTYISQSLSGLEITSKVEYDKIYFDYTSVEPEGEQWPQEFIAMSVPSDVKSEHYDVQSIRSGGINLDMDDHMLEVPEIILGNTVTGVMSHIVVDTDALVTHSELFNQVLKADAPHNIKQLTQTEDANVKSEANKDSMKSGYVTEFMTEAEMMACREEAKQKVQYATSVYKCELCIIGFYTQQQVEDHFVSDHRAKPGYISCKVCYVYIEESKLRSHIDAHYYRHTCKLCSHVEYSARLAALHVKGHMARAVPSTVIKIEDTAKGRKASKKRREKAASVPPKPGDLRKLLSKTTIEGYQCLECDMFFKNSRARKNHVARFHREGLQCDHCKKRFVNRTTLATHLKLHEGPLPRGECPVCHKMVRTTQLKYHIKRHESTSRYICTDCDKVFSHLATYQAHLKYSRAHAADNVFKFPCPMCNKGYPSKEQMQDHFNYQHLGKTTHKCPVCAKPIASRANVEKHMMRVHGEKKEKPRNHRCHTCAKTFTDRKALTQHEVIHSGERPLTCDICGVTFKQKASLYTHKKRVHKVFPQKRVVEFMDIKPDQG